MQLSARTSLYIVLAASALSLLCCKKPPFHSGTGLYSVKQYHTYMITSIGDTDKLVDTKISTVAMDNNYLAWNGIDFHMYINTDSLVTYIKDTSINGNYQIIYTLWYLPKTDKVNVEDHLNKKLWFSF